MDVESSLIHVLQCWWLKHELSIVNIVNMPHSTLTTQHDYSLSFPLSTNS